MVEDKDLIGKALKCKFDKFGNYTNGKLYPMEHSMVRLDGSPTDFFVRDDDGDKMDVLYLLRKYRFGFEVVPMDNRLDLLKSMDKEELIKLIVTYDDYIIGNSDRMRDWCPVCVQEFYDCEFMLLMEEEDD